MPRPQESSRKPVQFYLDLFNRKERNLLIRDALGDRHSRLAVSDDYLRRIVTALKIPMPSSCSIFWWTDYHIDWLVGALTLFAEPYRLDEERELTALDARPTKSLLRNGGALISGSQEDADLVISYKNTIILIEAKAFTSFTQKQVESKAKRLADIKQYYQTLQQKGAPEVEIHSILTSPDKPPDFCGTEALVVRGSTSIAKIAWMPLYVDNLQGKFRVTRCGANGLRSSVGQYWRCVRAMRFKNLDSKSLEET